MASKVTILGVGPKGVEAAEKLKAKQTTNKYVQYLKNCGGKVRIVAFLEDWEPIGGALLESMVSKNEVELKGLNVILLEK